MFFDAFIQCHKLFGEPDEVRTSPYEAYSSEDLAQISWISSSLTKHTPHARIESGERVY